MELQGLVPRCAQTWDSQTIKMLPPNIGDLKTVVNF